MGNFRSADLGNQKSHADTAHHKHLYDVYKTHEVFARQQLPPHLQALHEQLAALEGVVAGRPQPVPWVNPLLAAIEQRIARLEQLLLAGEAHGKPTPDPWIAAVFQQRIEQLERTLGAGQSFIRPEERPEVGAEAMKETAK